MVTKMKRSIYDIIDRLENNDRRTLLCMIQKKAENSNSDETALYFGDENDLFVTIENDIVEVNINGEKHTIAGQELLKKYK